MRRCRQRTARRTFAVVNSQNADLMSLRRGTKDPDPVEAIHIQEIVDLFGQSPFLWPSSPIGCYRDSVHVPQPTTERAIFRMTDFIRNGLSAWQTLAYGHSVQSDFRAADHRVGNLLGAGYTHG